MSERTACPTLRSSRACWKRDRDLRDIADGDEPPEPVSDDMLARLAEIYTFKEYLLGHQEALASGDQS